MPSAHTLAIPDPELPFQNYDDASFSGTRCILVQNRRTVAYARYATNFRIKRSIEKLLSVNYMLLFQFFMYGDASPQATPKLSSTPTTNPCVWICSQSSLSRKEKCWVLFLQRFQFTVTYVPRKNNKANSSRTPPGIPNWTVCHVGN